MIAKQIIRSILLLIILGSLAMWAHREYQRSQAAPNPSGMEVLPAIDGDQVIMTYFISGTRCTSCKRIESLARETAEKDFSSELAGKTLVFRVIDTGELGHEHFIRDYQITSKTVILSHRRNGKEVAWKDMAAVWDLLDDPPGFHRYLGTQIRHYLGT